MYWLCKLGQLTSLPQSLQEMKNNNTYANCHIASSHPHLSYSSPNPGSHSLCVFLPSLPTHQINQILPLSTVSQIFIIFSFRPQLTLVPSPSTLQIRKGLLTSLVPPLWDPYLPLFSQGPEVILYEMIGSGPSLT